MPYEDEDPPVVEPDFELDELARGVIGAAIEVHRRLGPGIEESLYHAAMCVELRLRGMGYASEVVVDVIYKNEKIGVRRIDLIVGGRLLVELKAVEALSSLHKAQVLGYLRLTGLRLGLLINFNVEILKDGIRRIIRPSKS